MTALADYPEISHVQRFSTKPGMIKTDDAFQGMVLKGVGPDVYKRQPQARGHKARYREDAFYELEKVAKQRFNTDNVKLEVKSSRIFRSPKLLKRWSASNILLPI